MVGCFLSFSMIGADLCCLQVDRYTESAGAVTFHWQTLQFRGFGELGVQFGDEARHLFLEGVAVVFDFLGADVAAGREDVAVRGVNAPASRLKKSCRGVKSEFLSFPLK
jgi:hypothetical protein